MSRFSGLIHDFLDAECSSVSVAVYDGDCDGDPADSKAVDALAMAEKVRKAARQLGALLDRGRTADDPFLMMLAGDVARAAEEMAALRGAGRPAFRRAVARRLREVGYDAAVCQTRWRATRDVTAGNYEFIDVVTAVPASASGDTGKWFIIVDWSYVCVFVCGFMD
uniref:Uncharacterized protein n=1 Tax=Oryza brachyantha TaxID=4533 RepID=J3N808_ORYBR